jgi:hypothetical protein
MSDTSPSYLANFSSSERSRRSRAESVPSRGQNQPETANRAVVGLPLLAPIAANARVACDWPDAAAADRAASANRAAAADRAADAEPTAAAEPAWVAA